MSDIPSSGEALPTIVNIPISESPRLKGVYLQSPEPFHAALVACGVQPDEAATWTIYSQAPDSDRADPAVVLSAYQIDSAMRKGIKLTDKNYDANFVNNFNRVAPEAILRQVAGSVLAHARTGFIYRNEHQVKSKTALAVYAGTFAGLLFGTQMGGFEDIGIAFGASFVTYAAADEAFSVRYPARRMAKRIGRENPRLLHDLGHAVLPVFN